MPKSYFRELKNYSVQDIASGLGVDSNVAEHLIRTLKKYGIIKAVGKSKVEYEGILDSGLVWEDDERNFSSTQYVFHFVGVIILENYVFKCFPKYITLHDEPVEELKKVLKVIRKYNSKEPVFHLYNGDDNNQIFNRLAVQIYLLYEFFENGLYINQKEIIETNGDGEILWDETIDEAQVLMRDNRPYYVELKTRNIADDEADYISRLHACILTASSKELKDAGLLELFDIAEVNLANARLYDFGEKSYILYRIQRELSVQFVSRKRSLLKTMYTFISHLDTGQSQETFSLYGTDSYHVIWEKICTENFSSVLYVRLADLPPALSEEYYDQKESKLVDLIGRPVWWRDDGTQCFHIVANETLRPDLVCIFSLPEGGYCFGIFDAKYYDLNIAYDKVKKKGEVTGQIGVADITKQYMYQLAFDDFICKQGYSRVLNAFLCPNESGSVQYGYVEMPMFSNIGKKMENILIIKLCAEEMYDIYLSEKHVYDYSKYFPV